MKPTMLRRVLQPVRTAAIVAACACTPQPQEQVRGTSNARLTPGDDAGTPDEPTSNVVQGAPAEKDVEAGADQNSQVMANLDAQLDKHPADDWARSAERTAWDVLDKTEFVGTSLRVRSVRCNAVMCKTVVSWQDTAEEGLIKGTFVTSGMCKNCEMVLQPQPAAKETRIWTSKPGFSLPDAQGRVVPQRVIIREQRLE